MDLSKCHHFKTKEIMYRWEDEPEEEERSTLVAIGEYIEGCEECEAQDSDIFYFFESEKEYKSALNKPFGYGFIIRELIEGH